MKIKTIVIIFVILAVVLFFFFRSRKKKNEKRLTEKNTKTSIKVVNQEMSTINYTVKKGETLSIIANKKNVTLAEIIEVNPQIKNINLIQIGQTIKIPTK